MVTQPNISIHIQTNLYCKKTSTQPFNIAPSLKMKPFSQFSRWNFSRQQFTSLFSLSPGARFLVWKHHSHRWTGVQPSNIEEPSARPLGPVSWKLSDWRGLSTIYHFESLGLSTSAVMRHWLRMRIWRRTRSFRKTHRITGSLTGWLRRERRTKPAWPLSP